MRRATPLKKIFIEVWKIMIMFLSKWVMCRFHVNLPGCVGFMFVVFFWCLILMCAIIFCCCCYFLRDVVCGAFIFLRFAVSKPHESGPASPAFSFFALRNVSKSTPKQLGATRKFEGFAQSLWLPKEISQTVCMLEENPGLKATLLHIHHVCFSVNEIFGKEGNTKTNTMFTSGLYNALCVRESAPDQVMSWGFLPQDESHVLLEISGASW